MAAIEAYVANLYWLNTGKAGPEPVALPIDYDTAQALCKRLGVANGEHDMVITETHTDISGLDTCLSPYENLEELNYLVALIDQMDENELATFEAAVEHGEYTSDIEQLINLAQNLDCYSLYTDISNAEELGEMILDDGRVPEHLQGYIDYEAYGQDIAENEGGEFTTHGYIYNNQSSFVQHYNGRDVPEEHRIFERPAPKEQARPATIPETLAKLQTEIKQAATQTDRPRPAAQER